MKCCSNCFNDSFMSNQISSMSSDVSKKCDLCNSEGVQIVEVKKLADFCGQVLDLYHEDKNGESLASLLKRDWHLFVSIDDDKLMPLLDELFEDVISKKKFIYKHEQSANSELWEKFRSELKHRNRFFPTNKPNLEHLENLFNHLILENPPPEFFRARIEKDGKVFDHKDLEKPPKELTSSGRANPVGISYLYTASCVKTAVSEVRPQVYDKIYVATFKKSQSLILLDLRDPRMSISPFALKEEDLPQLHIDLEYLCRLGEELSKPVLPYRAKLEYLASQFLCEFIKHQKFDGVVFKSSVGPGDNYTFFNDEKVEVDESISLKEVQIKSVGYEF